MSSPNTPPAPSAAVPNGDGDDANTGGDAVAASIPPAVPPVQSVCDRIYTAAKGEKWQEILMMYEELHSIPGLEDEVSRLGEVTHAWGRALEAAKKIGADTEYVHEMNMDFEDIFGFRSPYLSVMMFPDEMHPCEALRQLNEEYGFVSPDGVDGVLEKYRQLPREVIQAILQCLREEYHLELTTEASEKLQKFYVFRMKTENPEVVYDEMIKDGLKPTVPFAFNLVFGHQSLEMKTPMQYYDEMLSYGVKPHATTFRLLSKHRLVSREDAAMMRRRAAGNTSVEHSYMDRFKTYQQEGNHEEAERLFDRLVLEGMLPDKYIYNHLIGSCRRCPDIGENWYRRMLNAGIEPNATTFGYLIQVFRDTSVAESCDKWLDEMTSRGTLPDAHSYCAVLDTFVRIGNRGKVAKVFKQVLERTDGVLNASILNTVMRLGPFDWAVGCLALLLGEGLHPTSHTRSALQNQARDDTSHTMVAEMQSCQWDRSNLLLSQVLVNPERGTTPSFLECMRLMLRDLKLEAHLMDLKTANFNREVDKARASRPRTGPVPI